jgi:carboxypeptidase T
MKNVIVVLTLIFLTSSLLADTPGKYSQIKIFVPDAAALQNIWSTGIDYEGVSGKIGGWMEFVAGSEELRQLSQNNISYSVVIDDMTRDFQKRIARAPQNAFGFGDGSMSGHYTYDEVLRQLDSMKLLYPTLITVRESLIATDEGRAIWIVKISSNPGINDPAKPEVLYTALHHAREPEGMMATIYYMWWLLQNYGIDAEATYLVNHRQMYFIPVTNPDGYAYNQTIAPGGGGMWRKNRHNNGDGSYGIDLNRNYGNYSMWNSPYGGSSTITNSETYRGTAPFSEFETQAIAYFLAEHNVKTCLNYHTWGNYLIYPWGCYPWESDDSLTFREFAFDMTGYNRYLSGIDMQTVNYVTRGGSDDYMYGDDSKPITYAMTPEVGNQFWAAPSDILPFAIENLGQNIYNAYIAGQYTVAKRFDITDQNLNGGIERGETFSLTITFANKGLGDASHIHATVSATNTAIQWSVSTDSITVLTARNSAQLTFTGLRSGSSLNSSNSFIVTITDPDGYLHRDTMFSPFGTPFLLFADSAGAGTTNWNTGVSWGTTGDAHTAPASFTDSPAGDYPSSTDNSLTLLNPIDLYGTSHSLLKFWTKWAIEPRYDFCFVEVSTDSGTTWSTVRSPLSHRGSGNGSQTTGTWGYDGYNPGLNWDAQQIDLSPYSGSKILVRFRLSSDGDSRRDGIYVDDIRIIAYKDTSSTVTFDLPVAQRWSLFSLPLQVDVGTKAIVFPNAVAGAYGYEGTSGYAQKDTVVMGKGYWVKFDAPEVLSIPGFLIDLATIDVEPGWNLIGSISSPVPVNTIGGSPGSMTLSSIFQYEDGKYSATDTIHPGHGYWVKANEPGTLTLSASPGVTSKNRVRMIATSELPPSPPAGESVVKELPKEFRLEQNYPNPFNPSTTINYALPNSIHVTLKVYNTLGQEIATLIDGMQDAGYRSVRFEMNNIPSGIYIFRLTAGSFTDVKKMVIIK